jgi:hypothetical protein
MRSEHPTALRRLQPIQKAAKLIAENRVRHAMVAHVYVVAGDTAEYRVIASPDGIVCSCPAQIALCSHVLAVAQVRLADAPLPDELLADVIGEQVFRVPSARAS